MSRFLAPNFAPELISQLRNYSKLMRIDKPIGILLLMWPTLWALWLAGSASNKLKRDSDPSIIEH